MIYSLISFIRVYLKFGFKWREDLYFNKILVINMYYKYILYWLGNLSEIKEDRNYNSGINKNWFKLFLVNVFYSYEY